MRVPTPSRSPVYLLIVVCSGVFVSALDQTSVITALPEAMVDLNIPVSRLDHVAWLVTAYLLGFTVALPLLGRIGDVHGHAALFRGALALFAVGSVVTALGDSLSVVLTGRVIQAIGGGALVPAALALGTAHSPWRHPAVVLGVIGAAAEVGAVLGPLYGGIIIHWLGWRWIFWTNLPVVALLMAGTVFMSREHLTKRTLDLPGGLLLAGVLTLVTVGLAQRHVYGGLSAGWVFPLALLTIGAALAGVLIIVERRSSAPLLAPQLVFAPRFAASLGVQLLVGGALIMALVTVPLMTDTTLGKAPLEGGLRLMRLTGAIPIGAVLGGLAARWFGSQLPMLTGLALAALGLWLMSGWETTISDPTLSAHLAIAGLGFGLVIAPLLTEALNAGGEEHRSTALAFITASKMLGMTLGLAALSAWGMGYFQMLTADLAFPLPFPGETAEALSARQADYARSVSEASADVFSGFFRAGTILSLVAIVPVLFIREKFRRNTFLL